MNLNWAIIKGKSEEQLIHVPSGSVDMVMTSPPYDQIRDYHGTGFGVSPFILIVDHLYRVLKPGGTVIWVVGDQTKNGSESGTSFEQALHFKTVGFNLHDTMIYSRSSPPLSHKRYEQSFEYMFCFTKGSPKTFNGIREPKLYPEMKTRRKNWHRWADGSFKVGNIKVSTTTKLRNNIFHYNMGHVTKDRYAHKHPAIYPEALVRDQIHTWSNAGDTVLDPFAGSGTTGKVALEMGRKFIGVEISEEYARLAKRRVSRRVSEEATA